MLEVRGLELKVASRGTARDGDGDGVRCEVCDEALDTREELDVWPARVLEYVALGEVVVDREGDVWEEREQVRCCGVLGCRR